jgi:hypothetical protein
MYIRIIKLTNMKKTILNVLLMAAIMTIASCSNEPIVIPYNLGDVSLCLPANPNFGPYQVQTYTVVQADVIDKLEEFGVSYSPDRIENAKLDKAEIAVTSAGLSLDEISSAELYVRQAGQTTDGEQVAYSQNIPAGAQSITLQLNGVDLKPYLISNSFELVLKVLNKDKTGGTPAICVKLTNSLIKIEAKK